MPATIRHAQRASFLPPLMYLLFLPLHLSLFSYADIIEAAGFWDAEDCGELGLRHAQ